MSTIKTLLASMAGTTYMTLYSYATAQKRKKQFREPVLLHKFIESSGLPVFTKKGEWLDGWLLHYATGLLFSTVYDRIWEKTKAVPTVTEGVVMGAASGLAGVSIWNVLYKLHPDPPQVDIREYSKHLMVAHMLFGLFAALGYRLPEEVPERYEEGERHPEKAMSE